MPSRVGVDSPAARVGAEQPGSDSENQAVGLVEVRDRHVEMDLLRTCWIGPLRRLVVRDTLKAEHQPLGCVQSREVRARGPPTIRSVDLTPKQRLVEPGKPAGVGAIQNDALQRATCR